MGITDGFKDKAKDMTDAVAEEVDEKTGGKYKQQVDKAKDQVQEELGLGDEEKPEQEPQ